MATTRAFHREPRAHPASLGERPTCAITRDHNHELLTLPKDRSAPQWAEHYQIAQRWHEHLAAQGVPHRLETMPDGRIRQIYLHRLIGASKNGSQSTHWCCEGKA